MTVNIVKLAWYEMQHALQVGGGRLIEQHRQAPARQTFSSTLSKNNKWQVNIEGAMGEAAVAKFLRTYWDGSINKHDGPDVGGFVEVRTCSFENGWLWIWEKDQDDRPVVLVTGKSPTFKIVGWIYAGAAKQEEYWQATDAPNNRHNSACWFVPPELLEDPKLLASRVSELRLIYDQEKRKGA